MQRQKIILKFKPGFLICVLLLLFLNSAYPQLNISSNNNAVNLAQTILGNGITVSNATLNCGGNAAGTFSYSGLDLGISDGIILTTGHASEAANNGGYFSNTINGNNYSDVDLIAINSKAKYDVCILEFDFTPICDTLRINYVFGSEEYPQYLYLLYNDVFGLFLTGPNPLGGNYLSKNIATLPNGTTPVSIDSINQGWPTSANSSHSEFYHDNFNSPNNDIAYNGYTIPINSKAALVPCSPYHMKIAIADGGNGHNDSGVFIKGNSLTCQNIPVVTSNTLFTCANNGTVSVNISNYSGTPSYTWFPGGQNTSVIQNVTGGTYTCIVNLPGQCSNFTVTATIPNASTLNLSTPSSSLCKGQSILLNASGADSYTWQPGTGLSNTNTPNPIASPTISTNYSLSATAASGCKSFTTISIFVPTLALTADFIASTYETDIDHSTIQFTDHSTGATNWIWDFQEAGGSLVKDPSYTFSSTGTFVVHLTVTDVYHCSNTVSKTIVIDDVIKDLYTFYAPNAFTANGDFLNDSFLPIGEGWDDSHYKLDIYDKWGVRIFTTTDPKKGWNGFVKKEDTPVQQDIYVWKVMLKDVYKKEHAYIGHVTLLK